MNRTNLSWAELMTSKDVAKAIQQSLEKATINFIMIDSFPDKVITSEKAVEIDIEQARAELIKLASTFEKM